jgi:enterochelin esterase-like enzyme
MPIEIQSPQAPLDAPDGGSTPPPPEPPSGGRPWARPALSAGAVVIAALALHVSGTLADTAATLEVMGFDPDRARLIADLVGAAIATAAGALLVGAIRTSILAGSAGGLVLFAHTFLDETRSAIGAKGPAGSFDAVGWALSTATLLVAFTIVAWATASLARIVRCWLIEAGGDLAEFGRARHGARRLARPAAVAVTAGVLALTLPVFADMVNYSPDAHMRDGHSGVALTQDATAVPAVSNVTEGSALLVPPELAQGGSGTSSVLRTGTPWTAWQPSGQGQLVRVDEPAPWVGGTKSTALLQIYLPPGYGTSGRAYPVLYAVPWDASLWITGANLTSMLDSMITAGQIPASIVVFAAQVGGPYPASECANSVDGREWFETYLVNTVVPYVDATYRTIKTAGARSVLGFSQGGFCSTMLVLRHPDVFATAIAISGYYEAGIVSNQTPNAYRPFGGNPAAEAQYSPIRLVGQLPPAQRRSVLLVLEGDPADPFYGPQYSGMVSAAKAAGVPVLAIQSPSGHGWPTVRSHLPGMLEALAQHENALGVFA